MRKNFGIPPGIATLLCFFLVAGIDLAFCCYIARSHDPFAQTVLSLCKYRYDNGKGSVTGVLLLFMLPAGTLGLFAGYALSDWRPLRVFAVIVALAAGMVGLETLNGWILEMPIWRRRILDHTLFLPVELFFTTLVVVFFTTAGRVFAKQATLKN